MAHLGNPGSSSLSHEDTQRIARPTSLFANPRSSSPNESLRPASFHGSPNSTHGFLHPYSFNTHDRSRSSQDFRLNRLDRPVHDTQSLSGARLSTASLAVPLPHNPKQFSRSRPASPMPLPGGVTASPAPSIMGSTDGYGNQKTIARSVLSSDNRILFPISPQWIDRWDRNVTIEKEDSHYVIEKMTKAFVRKDTPEGWTPYTHPEGTLYFYHEKTNTLTDGNLYDTAVLYEIDAFAGQVERKLKELNFDLPLNTETVLFVMPDEGDGIVTCGYYFVDHKERCLYWVDDFEIDWLIQEVYSVTSPTHIKHEMDSQYWMHFELYPNLQDVNKELIDELKGIILHLCADSLTSNNSTAPFPVEELLKMGSVVDRMSPCKGPGPGYAAATIGRLMGNFCHQRFLDFASQHCARVNHDQRVYSGKDFERTMLITVISPLLFFAPNVHLQALKKIWVDNLMKEDPWHHFITKLTDEWQEFTLYGTVLLNANVAFLAIPNVFTPPSDLVGGANDNGMGQGSNNLVQVVSAVQLASYVSIISSVGSIIVGLLLVRQNRNKSKQLAKDAAKFLSRMTHPSFGLETLAIMYSLPYALLMWAMLSFLIAFTLMCMLTTNFLSRMLVGAAWLMVGMLLVWCVLTAWESGDGFWRSIFWRVWGWMTERLKWSKKDSNQVAGEDKGAPRKWTWPFVRGSIDSGTTLT